MADLTAGFTVAQLQAIQRLIQDCGQQAQSMASEQFQVFEKAKNDYVTTVDRALDQRLTTGFSELFPEQRVITEENPGSWQAFGNQRLWLIDPLDGTEDFIQHKLHYAVMVGLMEAYEPIAGWIGAPAFNHLYYGGKQLGLFEVADDDAPIPLLPSPPEPPSTHYCPLLIGDKDRRRFGQAIAKQIPGVQFDAIGSFGLKVMRVICGQAGIYVYLNKRVKLWDTTGPIALARQAGLICCDLSGEPLKFTPDVIDPHSLAHLQTIIVGWPEYIEALLPALQKAVALTV
ncbi:MAG: hypothetical protein Kow00121_35250 [Elainellaceae cyanobacterium]